MPFSADELAELRSTLEAELLAGTAVIQRKTNTRDSSGGWSEAWAAVGTVACRVSPMDLPATERLIADRLTLTAPWSITVPALTDVTVQDRLVVDSHTYEVTRVLGPRTEELLRRVYCSEVT